MKDLSHILRLIELDEQRIESVDRMSYSDFVDTKNTLMFKEVLLSA